MSDTVIMMPQHASIVGCSAEGAALSDANSPLPVLDSTRLLAQAAVRRAVEPRTGAHA